MVDDATLKIIPDALMADLLERIDAHGFGVHAERGDVEEAIQAGAAEVIQIEQGGRRHIMVKPRPPLRTVADREQLTQFVQMKREIFEIHAQRTQFHVVGQGARRPSWAPAPK